MAAGSYFLATILFLNLTCLAFWDYLSYQISSIQFATAGLIIFMLAWTFLIIGTKLIKTENQNAITAYLIFLLVLNLFWIIDFYCMAMSYPEIMSRVYPAFSNIKIGFSYIAAESVLTLACVV